MFFKNFDKINYDGRMVTNIVTSSILQRWKVDDFHVFQKYQVSVGDTPESIAYALYKKTSLYWTILVANDIVDPFNGWLHGYIEEVCLKKWGNLHEIHHFYNVERPDRIIDDYDSNYYRSIYPNLPKNIIPVTNYEHESNLNNELIDIVTINPLYINKFVEEYQNTLSNIKE